MTDEIEPDVVVVEPDKHTDRVKCVGCLKMRKPKEFYPDDKSGVCIFCKDSINDNKRQVASAERRGRALEKRKAKRLADKKAAAQKARRMERTQRLRRVKEDPTGGMPKQDKAVVNELVKRELTKKSLVNFIKTFNVDYKAGWVHKLICSKLEAFTESVRRGESPRLMIFMPPRHGKSEIASIMFPLWFLANNPSKSIIASSYAVSLPIGFSRRMLSLIESDQFKNLFPNFGLDKRAQSAETWKTNKNGTYVAAGIGGGITGKGGDIILIDDPLKDSEEADSERIRESIWSWYGSTFRTRLAPGGGILIINTRWSDDDVSGRILRLQREQENRIREEREDMKRLLDNDQMLLTDYNIRMKRLNEEEATIEKWEVISFPALAEHDEYIFVDGEITAEPIPGSKPLRRKGEALHPERFNRTDLLRIQRSLQPRHWSALYQQNPVPDEGLYFTKNMVRYFEGTPDWRQWNLYMACDLAVGDKHYNDWSVFLVGAVDFEGDLHVIDMIRFKGGTAVIVEHLIATLKKYQSRMLKFGIERGHIQMSIMPILERELKAANLFIPFDDTLKPVTDKSARARPAQGMMQQGRVKLPTTQPWVEGFVSELLRFPAGVHDDVVDALAWLVRMIAKEPPPRRKTKKVEKSWKDRISSYISDRKTDGGAMEA